MALVVEMLAPLLSIDEPTGRLFDQCRLRAQMKFSQREDAWNASKNAGIRTRRERVVLVRIRRPKDM